MLCAATAYIQNQSQLQNQSLDLHHACTKHRLQGPNSLHADRSTRRIIGPRRKATLAIRRLHGFRWSHDGSYWANYWHLREVPDEAARWHPATHSYSIDPAYAANQRIAAYSMHHPGNPGAGSRPTPLPEMPKRQQRAAFVQQLEACIRIPSVRLPRTMRRMEMQGRGLRMLYLDDNNRISCCLPCAQIPHALTMQYAANT